MTARGAIAIVLGWSAAASAFGQAAEPTTPLAYLVKMLSDPETADPSLVALRGTADQDIAAIMVALTRSGDKKRRLFGVVTLAELKVEQTKSCLLERVNYDPAMAIRAEALGHLMDLKALTAEQIAQALKIPDDNVRSLAARELVRLGQAAAALPALRELAGSKDATTAALAQMCLLGLGHRDHEAALRGVMRDPQTAPATLALLLGQIEDQKITPAMGLALDVATNEEHSIGLRVRAYRAATAVSNMGGLTLRDAIAGSQRTVFQAQLLKVLASRADAGKYLRPLSEGTGPVAALARLELARAVGGPAATQAVSDVAALGHPVLIAYVLDRAGQDIKDRGKEADFYTPALVAFIRSVDPKPARLGELHFFAAGAASRLIELGTPAALAGLKGLLAGRANAITRAAAAGMLRAKNPAAAELARPLLTSPYGELATDAALVLGQFGDPAAAAHLQAILTNARSHPPALVVLASWYLLKAAGQTKPAAEHLAKLIK